MVTLKVNLVKKDFVWISLLIIFVGVGLVYAYGGNRPAVMGHSAGELHLSAGVNGVAIFNDNVGIGLINPSEKLDVNGNVKATAFLYSSDRRLKKNIEVLSGVSSLKKIIELEGVSFRWIKNNDASTGFIAQDVEHIFPDVVTTDINTGLKSVNYAALMAPLVEAVKEQQSRIDKLEAEIDEIKKST